MISLKSFKQIYLVDFEFSVPPGGLPEVHCMVAKEYFTGHTKRVWKDDLKPGLPSIPLDESILYVAYYASAEMLCHLVLDWPLPVYLLDLFTEFRNLHNGKQTPCGWGLLGALTAYGINGIDAVEKNSMRELAIRGGRYTFEEQQALMEYCLSDVNALEKLLSMMMPSIELGRALLRGRYMKAAARIEYNGVPIDIETLEMLRDNWEDIHVELIRCVDADYGIYQDKTFKRDRFEQWLINKDISWPLLPSGQLDLSDDTFRQMARSCPQIAPLRELRSSLSSMRLLELPVGKDARNRCMLSAFRARTGRNQPSNSKFIFGPSTWLRSLIKPQSECGIAYIDWSQQEFGIAAALSGDPLMQEAYISGDPYLSFAKQAGAVPADGTKKSHPAQRSLFKASVLAVQYGMGAESLASRIGGPTIKAKELLLLHRNTYKVFWEWSDACLDHAMLYGRIWTVFGWYLHIGDRSNPRSIRNFPMQANGAEMLRLACCMASEAGIRICAPVHDAILIEAPLNELDETIKKTQEIMEEASAVILNGFRLRSDVKIFRYPNRFMDERGEVMWNSVMDLIRELPCSD